MKRAQLVGGIIILIASALTFLFLEGSSSTPVAISLVVVGIALVASARKRRSA